MESGEISFDLGIDNIDDNDFGSETEEREIEIDGLLSKAFDDLSSVTDDESEDNSDEDNHFDEDKNEDLNTIDRENIDEEVVDKKQKEDKHENNGQNGEVDEIHNKVTENGLSNNLIKVDESVKLNDDSNLDDVESLRNVDEFVENGMFSFEKLIKQLPSKVNISNKKINGWSSHNYKMTSTPVKTKLENLINSKYYHNEVTIPEEKEENSVTDHSFISKKSESGKSDNEKKKEEKMSSLFKYNSFESSEKLWPNGEPILKLEIDSLKKEDKSQFSYKHIQLLLDENERLVKELENCKTKLSVLNGDYLGITFNYKQLESKYELKESEICELKGKLVALEIKHNAQVEAKNEFLAKLSLAESTIESLNRQLTNMAKSDSLIRVRENYETLFNKLKNQFETENIVIKGEVEGLKFEIESKRQEIDKLKLQLEEKQATIDQLEIEKLENIENLKAKYQQILKESNQKIDYQALINQKNQEIESLQTKVNLLRKNLVQNDDLDQLNGHLGLNLESDVIKEIKIEFNKSLENLKERRKQVSQLQSQLLTSTKEVNELKDKLQIAESKSSNLQKMMEETNEIWKQQVEATLLSQFQKEWAKSQESFENIKKEEMAAFERNFDNRLETCVNLFVERLEKFGQDISVPLQLPNELESMFQPLIQLWTKLDFALKKRIDKLNLKQEEMLKARENLAQALLESKSFEINSSNHSFIEFKKEIEDLKNESIQMKLKLEKYKKHYHLLKLKHENAVKELKKESAQLIARKEQEFIIEKEKLMGKLKRESDEIVKCLSSNFLNGLNQLKLTFDSI